VVADSVVKQHEEGTTEPLRFQVQGDTKKTPSGAGGQSAQIIDGSAVKNIMGICERR
jgi:hypothetical protein